MVAAGTAFAGTTTLALAIAPVILGLGYGPITPASSHILARTAHPSRLALTFSIKQTGVPAGAALAGALLPVLALQMGWHAAFAAIALAGIPVVLLSELVRKSLAVARAALRAAARTRARRADARARDSRLPVRGAAGLPRELPRRVPDRIAALLARRSGPRAHGRERRRCRRAHRVGRLRRFPPR